MKIAVAALRSNPFRHLERYPINREKIEALKASISTTTFWDNLLARPAPAEPDAFELAFGHHRWTALQELGIEFVDIPVRDLSDTDMARIMAHENMTEWAHSAAVEHETVRALVEGFAAGRLKLPPVNSKEGGTVRFAPSFVPRGRSSSAAAGELAAEAREPSSPAPAGELAYTVATLAEFLGWKRYKVEAALSALALIENGLAVPETFDGLSSKQAEVVARQVRSAARRPRVVFATAQQIGVELAAGMRRLETDPLLAELRGDAPPITVHDAHIIAEQIIEAATPKLAPPPPLIDDFAWQVIKRLRKIYFSELMQEKLKALIENRAHLREPIRQPLTKVLKALAQQFQDWAVQLEARPATTQPAQSAGVEDPANLNNDFCLDNSRQNEAPAPVVT
jgi:hypothetical protein